MRPSSASNVLLPSIRPAVLAEIHHKCFDIVAICPPSATFSRAPFSGWPGPKPLRSAHWPKGLPGLKQPEMQKVKNSNDLMDFAVEVMRAASSANAVVMMTFPEDLGPSKLGSPASIWQREDVRQLEAAGLHRYAFYQGDWCSMDH